MALPGSTSQSWPSCLALTLRLSAAVVPSSQCRRAVWDQTRCHTENMLMNIEVLGWDHRFTFVDTTGDYQRQTICLWTSAHATACRPSIMYLEKLTILHYQMDDDADNL